MNRLELKPLAALTKSCISLDYILHIKNDIFLFQSFLYLKSDASPKYSNIIAFNDVKTTSIVMIGLLSKNQVKVYNTRASRLVINFTC